MIEGIIVILGLCITFLPVVVYFMYLINHVNKKTRFDYHLELVKDKKGRFGVVVAYAERISFGSLICLFGILLSEFFSNEILIELFIFNLLIYLIIDYFDEKNEK